GKVCERPQRSHMQVMVEQRGGWGRNHEKAPTTGGPLVPSFPRGAWERGQGQIRTKSLSNWNARARNRKSTMLPSCGCSQLSWMVGRGPMFRRSMWIASRRAFWNLAPSVLAEHTSVGPIDSIIVSWGHPRTVVKANLYSFSARASAILRPCLDTHMPEQLMQPRPLFTSTLLTMMSRYFSHLSTWSSPKMILLKPGPWAWTRGLPLYCSTVAVPPKIRLRGQCWRTAAPMSPRPG